MMRHGERVSLSEGLGFSLLELLTAEAMLVIPKLTTALLSLT